MWKGRKLWKLEKSGKFEIAISRRLDRYVFAVRRLEATDDIARRLSLRRVGLRIPLKNRWILIV